MPAALHELFRTAPQLADRGRAQARFSDFVLSNAELSQLGSATQALVLAIADHSPYLWELIKADARRLQCLINTPPQETLDHLLARLASAADTAGSEAELMRVLRRAKQEVALLVALCDLGGVWSTEKVMEALTASADQFVTSALNFILREASAKLQVPADHECGVVVLALGKHGGRELNYSSDTDLIVLFDPESPAARRVGEPALFFVRITQRLVKILQERTADGYVLRVDLRLRPDPGSTAAAISLPAAFFYYESFGQNWERAALIKARPIAGERSLGDAFIAQLTPFIWRRYFDYAAIADIHAMKRQIHAVRGHEEIAIAGHDLKLGRGGIREIEFFVQTQQLIFGGKRPLLRGARTLSMLAELEREDLISRQAREDLERAYLFLRETEHRLQMIGDQQTQKLPADLDELARFARFCGYGDLPSFAEDVRGHLTRVAEHYARLFETSPGLSSGTGSLVFTGVADDPETLETLAQLGFAHPAQVAETVRGWHFGRRSAVHSERAREVLTELMPALLEAFAQSADPDAAVAAFDQALARMKAAVELLSILKSNAELRRLFADILGSAPRLAEIVIRRPHVLDAAFDRNLMAAPLGEADFDARLATVLTPPAAVEDVLDRLRDFAQEESFLIGLRLLTGMITPIGAGEAYSALAASIVRACLEHVSEDFAARFGKVRGGRCVVLALGKLGSREMTAASDLDLILIYDFDPEHPESDGAEALHAIRYYARLSQRLISGLTVATRRGLLYQVDMRLRPSGRQGPLATQFRSFADYQAKEAETWEHMALVRARVIAGDASLRAEVEATRDEILARPRSASLRVDVAGMRALIAREKGEDDLFDLKYAAGGLIDIDFLAQFLCLRHAHENREMIDVAPASLIAKAGELGYLAPEQADELIAAHRLYSNVTQVLRTILNPNQPLAQASETVKRRLAAAADLPGFAQLTAQLAETGANVRAIFREIVG
ncbi:MAG TPA: bifunctional [glutamine synthetase] adenylyltransferase/[glutamine synthetase]-adenylyl-L-tyrosine phosphorylase [Methylovirgula sp.]|nr:bifunctional [glutamine synthetase] adenylyltransferase/[glutamine synthetase]-adenylyl-L-tyrosine phosphorylase [Methylovirgula sp.]